MKTTPSGLEGPAWASWRPWGLLNARLEQERGLRLAVRSACIPGRWWSVPWAVARQEHLALGETPNIAARLQGLAAPNTVVISAATLGLIAGLSLPSARRARPQRGG